MGPLHNGFGAVNALDLDAIEGQTQILRILLGHLRDLGCWVIESATERIVFDLGMINGNDVLFLRLLGGHPGNSPSVFPEFSQRQYGIGRNHARQNLFSGQTRSVNFVGLPGLLILTSLIVWVIIHSRSQPGTTRSAPVDPDDLVRDSSHERIERILVLLVHFNLVALFLKHHIVVVVRSLEVLTNALTTLVHGHVDRRHVLQLLELALRLGVVIHRSRGCGLLEFGLHWEALQTQPRKCGTVDRSGGLGGHG